MKKNLIAYQSAIYTRGLTMIQYVDNRGMLFAGESSIDYYCQFRLDKHIRKLKWTNDQILDSPEEFYVY